MNLRVHRGAASTSREARTTPACDMAMTYGLMLEVSRLDQIVAAQREYIAILESALNAERAAHAASLEREALAS